MGNSKPKRTVYKILVLIARWANRLRTIVTDLIIIGLVILFTTILINDLFFRKEPIHIEPFEVTRDLENQGYSGRVVANKLIDQLNEIGEKSKEKVTRIYTYSSRIGRTKQTAFIEPSEFIPGGSDTKQIDMEIPGARISVNSVSQFIKRFFGKKLITVAGEVVNQDNKLFVTTRVNEKASEPFKGENLDDILHQTAEHIYKCIKPFVIAQYYLANNNEPKCLETIQFIISQEPGDDDVLAYTLWGYILAKQQKYEEAIDKFEKATKLNLTFADVYVNWGGVLVEQRKYDEAIEKYKKVIDLDPRLAAFAYGVWGAVLVEQEKYDEAIEKLKKAIKLDPKFASAYVNWGSALVEQGKYDEAIEKYQKAIELDPRFAPAYGNWGDVLGRQGKYDEAIEKYQKVIEIDPEGLGQLAKEEIDELKKKVELE